MEDDVGVIQFEMFGNAQRLPMQDLFKRSARRTPDRLASLHQLERPAQGGPEYRFSRSQSAMKVNLSKHVVASLQVFFHRKNSPGRDIDTIALLVDLKRIDDPFEIVQTILTPGPHGI